jgi:hypothetical protein
MLNQTPLLIDLSPYAAKSQIAMFVGQIETLCGATTAALLGLGISVGCTVMLVSPFYPTKLDDLPFRYLRLSPFAIAILIEVFSVIFILRTLQNHVSPVLLRLATRQYWFPAALRPLVAGWWFVHFLLLVFIAHQLLTTFPMHRFPDLAQRLELRILEFVAFVAVDFSSNAFLLLAASAFSRGSFLIAIYRFRLLVDLVLAIALLVIPPAQSAFGIDVAHWYGK